MRSQKNLHALVVVVVVIQSWFIICRLVQNKMNMGRKGAMIIFYPAKVPLEKNVIIYCRVQDSFLLLKSNIYNIHCIGVKPKLNNNNNMCLVVAFYARRIKQIELVFAILMKVACQSHTMSMAHDRISFYAAVSLFPIMESACFDIWTLHSL